MQFIRSVRKFFADTSGAALVEYGLALLIVASIGAGVFNTLANRTSANVSAACTAVGATC